MVNAVFREVRDPRTDKLLFRFDPDLLLVEIVRRRKTTIIDLNDFREPCEPTLDSASEGVVISDY